jgi:hypothetical protein
MTTISICYTQARFSPLEGSFNKNWLASQSWLLVQEYVFLIFISFFFYLVVVYLLLQALGNEFLKGAAMVGVSTHGDAALTVVDNDLVMTSNISRQLCFDESDMHKTKADTLCRKVKEKFNQHIGYAPSAF